MHEREIFDREKAYQKQSELAREEQLKKIRYINRKTVDELIRPILNMDIIIMFTK